MSPGARKSLAIFVTAAGVRAIFISYFLRKLPHFSEWGINEAGVIARSLLLSHSFSAPFHDAHGPSAWLAPIYPGMVSAVFVVFGIQTHASALAVIAVNALCSALVGVVLYRIGAEFFSEPVGQTAGLLWAVSPAVAIMPLVNWDTCVSTLLAAFAVLLTLRSVLPGAILSRDRPHFIAGAMWGLAGLSSPALLAPVPFLAVWSWAGSKRLKAGALFVVGACLLILPWTLRNYLVFQKFIPVRSNFWAEMSYGNLGFQNHATGDWMEYQRLGEVGFGAVSKQRTLQYIHDHPIDFAKHTLYRTGQFWIVPEGMWRFSFWLTLATLLGLWLIARKNRPAALMFAIILTTYPIVYYISFVFSRYRHPVEPIMYLSLAFLLIELGKYLRRRGAISSRPRMTHLARDTSSMK